jgi:hypothetical protein
LNILLGAEAPWKNMFSRACAVFIKMVWYGDVCFKQRAVIEIPVAEKSRFCPPSIQPRSYSLIFSNIWRHQRCHPWEKKFWSENEANVEVIQTCTNRRQMFCFSLAQAYWK